MKQTLFGRALASLAAVTLVFGLVGCSDDADESVKNSDNTSAANGFSEEWPRTVETDDGELTLESQPERIVSTSTALTGAMLAVGAPVVASAATSPNVPDLSDDQGFFLQWSEEAKTAGVEKLWENATPEVELVVDYDPDLIVVSKNSGDSVFDQVDQLEQIAPVLVVDYSDRSWQEVTTMVAVATGHEAQAEEVIADFDAKVDAAAAAINVPDAAVSPFIVFGDGSGAAALTEEAPQSQVLERLGFELTEIPDEVKGNTEMGADRGDMVNLSLENIQAGLPGTVWIVIAGDETSREVIESEPAFNTSLAVENDQVYYTPGETFRLDYFSAVMLLDSIQEQFAA
ncbi:MAG: Fe2+-enterobactin ABC transporter substrate-binding protein [Corynebacterium sp.]|nr:Fe2+-enterobactin ABC transporter substrate-binding protein [Corynebacterium sp.]